MAVALAFLGADRRAQQADQGVEGGLAFLHAEAVVAADFTDQIVRQQGDRRAAGDARGAADAVEPRTLEHLARHDQRDLTGVFQVGHAARLAGVDQGDVARGQFHAVVALLQARTAIELEHRVVVVAGAGRHFRAGPVEIDVGQFDLAQLDGAALELPEFAAEFRPQGARGEAPAGLVDPAEPCLEGIAPDLV
ncbi:hypothetical protein D3C76_1134890 [compost metagenome]